MFVFSTMPDRRALALLTLSNSSAAIALTVMLEAQGKKTRDSRFDNVLSPPQAGSKRFPCSNSLKRRLTE